MSDRSFVFIRIKKDWLDFHSEYNVVDTDRSWSRTIVNENDYWTIVIFQFKTPTTFFYFVFF